MSVSLEALTPSSASSPHSFAPLSCTPTHQASAGPKLLAPAPLAGASTPTLTTREWIVPPRPKPGRKPATDTPPTKRKAQNRAAQRAFRERRAAKVGELEVHIRNIEDEDEREQTGLRSQIERLEAEVEHYREELLAWHQKCHGLESSLERERQGSQALMQELINLRDGRSGGTDAVALPPRRSAQKRTSIRQEQHPEPVQSALGPPEISMGCGACTSTSRCECIEQAFNMSNFSYSDDSIPKRPLSPQTSTESKRQRQSDEVDKSDPEALEVDFTTRFSTKPITTATLSSSTQQPAASSTTAADPCGFCQDGTPCICAEAAADNAQPNHLPHAVSQFTPPPSDGDVVPKRAAQFQPNPSNLPNTNLCANGPGTCDQCRADPQSTLFCKTLATSRTSAPLTTATNTTTNSIARPCTNASDPSGCCRTQPPPSRSAGLPLTCAGAYTTLSRHPHYTEASDDLASWMPSLQTRPMVRGEEGRPAMEVDAANVMSVLKYFDRRFGEGKGPQG